MVRKMAYIGFSYLIGLFFASFFYSDICVGAAVIIMVLALAAAVFIGKKKTILIVCAISFSIGMGWYSAYNLTVYPQITSFDGQSVSIDGKIVSVSEYSGDSSSYTIKGKINGSVSAKIICYGDSKTCEIGDGIAVSGKAVLPENTLKFTARDYYKAKGIYLIVNADTVEITPRSSFSLRRVIHVYREYISKQMGKYLSLENSGIAKAMLLGDKSGIDSVELTKMYRSGIGHIMAVSGTHLAVVCVFFELLITFLPLSRIQRFFVMLLPIGAFVFLADMTESVLRSAVMIIIVYLGSAFMRKADTLNSLGIAIIILTAANPFAVRDASFLLSVSAVAGIAAFAPQLMDILPERKKKSKIFSVMIYSFCASVAVLPVSLMFFDEISVISPFSGIILMPLCTVVLLCGVITAVTGGIAAPIMKISGLCCNVITPLTDLFGGKGKLCIHSGNTAVVIFVIVAAAAWVLYALKVKKIKQITIAAAVLYVSVIVSSAVYGFIPSDHVTAAIIKENSASVLIVHDKRSAAIIDLNRGGKAAESAVKYLNRLGIEKIDLLGLTVNNLTSEPIYMSELRLFDVGTVLVPQRDYNNEDAYLGDETVFYNDGTKIDMPNYSIILNENNTVHLLANGTETVLYDGKLEELSGNYAAVVQYNGAAVNQKVNSSISAYLDEDAPIIENEVTVKGKSFLLKIYDNSQIGLDVIQNGSSI